MDLTGINRFRQRLNAIQDDNLMEEVVRELVEVGRKHLEELYGTESIKIETEISGNTAKIFASGEQVAYLEYGTGNVGKGTYKGKLPTETRTFTDRYGDTHTTAGWEYYYPNDNTKRWGGWFYYNKKSDKVIFTKGMQAQAQIWRTAQYLREHASEIINMVLARHNI